MNEKRLSSRIIAYWDKLKGESENIPEMSKFRPAMVEEVWDKCIKVKVEIKDGVPRFKFEHIGAEVEKAIGKKAKSQDGMGIASVPGGRILSRVSLLLSQLAMPIQDQGEFLNEKSQMVKYRSCILPFGNKKGEITHVIVALSWRIFK